MRLGWRKKDSKEKKNGPKKQKKIQTFPREQSRKKNSSSTTSIFFSPKSSPTFSHGEPNLMDRLSFSIWETFFTWTKKLSENLGSTGDFPELLLGESEIFCGHRPLETTTSASTSMFVFELSDKFLVEPEFEKAEEKKFEIFPRKFVRILTGVEIFLSTQFSSADDDASVIGKMPLSKFEPFSDIVTSMTSQLMTSHKKQTSSKNEDQ